MNSIDFLSSNQSISYIKNASFAYRSNEVTSVAKEKDSEQEEVKKTSFADDINDEAIISDEAKSLLAKEETKAAESTKAEKESAEDKTQNQKILNNAEAELTTQQKQEVAKLELRDAEVKAHEQAHIASATGLNVSAPSYDFEIGPDGEKYAVGGEVSISFTKGKDHEDNIEKAQTMKNAALAPADPSSQDRSVAKRADGIIAEEKEAIAEERAEASQIAQKDSTSETEETETDTQTESVGSISNENDGATKLPTEQTA